MYYQFHKDLALAKVTERLVAEAMSELYGARIIEFSERDNYDFVLEGKHRNIPIEVKEDYWAEKTGNIAIEYSCRDKPSGIAVTKARYYVYRIHRKGVEDDFLFLSVPKLKSWIRRKLFWKSVIGGDRGSGTHMYLFKIQNLMDEGKGFHKLPIVVPKNIEITLDKELKV